MTTASGKRMVRSDPFWDHVTKMDNRFHCKFCTHKFAPSSSISRIKSHLSGVEGLDVKICTGVPDDVKKAAYQAILHKNKRLKTNSSSQNELRNTGSTFSTEQANGADIPIPTVDAESAQTEVMSIGHGMETTDFPMMQPSKNLRQTNASASQCLPQQQHGVTYGAFNGLTPQIGSSSYSLRFEDYGIWTDGANQYPSPQPILPTTDSVLSSESARDLSPMHLSEGMDWNGYLNQSLHAEPTNEEAPMPNCHPTMPSHPHLAHQKEIGHQNQFGGMTEATMPPNENRSNPPPEGAVGQVVVPMEEGNQETDEADQPGVRYEEIDQSEQRTPMMGNASNCPHGERAGITEATTQPNENGSNLPPEGVVGEVTQQDCQQTLPVNYDLPGNSRDNLRAELAPQAEIQSLKETRGVAFITKNLVGRMFERNQKTVWSLLMKDEVSSIGIYGMGGVGKTALMTHVHKKLLKGTRAFGNVSWVTVSQDFSIPKLQNLIAKKINLVLLHEDGVMERAAKLFEALEKKKSVIILDDLWHSFIPEDVGIPVRVNACKLIVTGRRLDVCRQVGCQEIIKIEPLSEEEAWTLFEEKLGCHVKLPPEITPFARSVAKECDGLPLGIITMAASMRGVDDDCEWRDVLRELRESKVRKDDMEPEVFTILRYSYLRLNDPVLRQTFLYCALFPEDDHISRKYLINFMISEGIIERMTSGREEFDKGHAILNKLENVCLLEDATKFDHNRCVKMHDLIRDMAIQIMDSQAMVKASAQLTELPDKEKWTCDLVRVSLMNNNIHGILSSRPSCPDLSTLFLPRNLGLEGFEESFFQKFPRLKVLDLSSTAIQNLPSSISDLKNLTALLLRNCKQLSNLPSLANLRALKMLDVRQTRLQKVPQGMELLSKLRYLNINNVRLKAFPTGILPHLLCLQSLNLSQIFIAKSEELAFLKMLEKLECCFKNLLDFKTHLKSCEEKQPLIGYNYTVGGLPWSSPDAHDSSKNVLVVNLDISRDLVLPKCIEDLEFKQCQDIKSLCSVSLLKNAPKLKYLEVDNCTGMECLLESSCSPNILESIGTLRVFSLNNLRFLIGAGVAPEPRALSSTFSCLKILKMLFCPSITKLFPYSLLKNLQNLEEIIIHDCKKMEEIMVTGEGDAVQDSNSVINTEVRLPKLKCLILRSLPELKSICSETLICDSLQEIRFVDCKKLKKIPLSLRRQSVEKTQAYPRDWWESLEWSDSEAFNICSGVCVFHDKAQKGVPKQESRQIHGVPGDCQCFLMQVGSYVF